MRYSLALANGAIKNSAEIGWIHHNNNTFRASMAELCKSDYSFVVLRSVYSRLSSVFLDKFVGDASDFRKRFSSFTEINSIKDISFKKFVSLLLERNALLKYDIHWRPQVDFLVFDNYCDYFCVEDFGNCVATLKSKIGFDVIDTRNFVKHGTDQFKVCEDKNYCDTSLEDLQKMRLKGLLPAHHAMYDNECSAMVSEIYANDLKLLEDKFGSTFSSFDSYQRR